MLNLAGQRFPDDYLTDLGSSAPMGRVAQPEEIAPAYVYLASDADSSFTVGEVIAVTGGRHRRRHTTRPHRNVSGAASSCDGLRTRRARRPG